jgi:hypothetical protein
LHLSQWMKYFFFPLSISSLIMCFSLYLYKCLEWWERGRKMCGI